MWCSFCFLCFLKTIKECSLSCKSTSLIRSFRCFFLSDLDSQSPGIKLQQATTLGLCTSSLSPTQSFPFKRVTLLCLLCFSPFLFNSLKFFQIKPNLIAYLGGWERQIVWHLRHCQCWNWQTFKSLIHFKTVTSLSKTCNRRPSLYDWHSTCSFFKRENETSATTLFQRS